MQDSAIRRMIYAPGSPVMFQIERLAQDKGIFAPLSLVRAGDRMFFCGNDGFQSVAPAATASSSERNGLTAPSSPTWTRAICS